MWPWRWRCISLLSMCACWVALLQGHHHRELEHRTLRDTHTIVTKPRVAIPEGSAGTIIDKTKSSPFMNLALYYSFQHTIIPAEMVHGLSGEYCKDTRPGQQLEAAQRQHADLCKLISAKAVTLHTILLGVSGTCYIERTLNQFKQLGLDRQRVIKLACKHHAHSIAYPNKLITTRRAIGKNHTSQSQLGRQHNSLVGYARHDRKAWHEVPPRGHLGQRCMDCPASMQRLNPRAGI
eukprot:1161166-Pelagomonas_calceolata.AAC.2